MPQHTQSPAATRPTAPEMIAIGLDVAMATSLLAHDPNAVAAAAGIASNSLIAAALGLDTVAPESGEEDPILAAWAREDDEEVSDDERGDGENEREEDDTRG
jgi:hypothetical protein